MIDKVGEILMERNKERCPQVSMSIFIIKCDPTKKQVAVPFHLLSCVNFKEG